eukprot:TRINITY_DN18092_c0_g1_i1.p1 TRINITY_DN18092_c0_g1~~TRINITY_DN18092_c0_g1_i1.p1  ORF type:complete len:413 (+),score=32.13 TRINITY_DN18092_c0_g1_i1:140-1378(+)
MGCAVASGTQMTRRPDATAAAGKRRRKKKEGLVELDPLVAKDGTSPLSPELSTSRRQCSDRAAASMSASRQKFSDRAGASGGGRRLSNSAGAQTLDASRSGKSRHRGDRESSAGVGSGSGRAHFADRPKAEQGSAPAAQDEVPSIPRGTEDSAFIDSDSAMAGTMRSQNPLLSDPTDTGGAGGLALEEAYAHLPVGSPSRVTPTDGDCTSKFVNVSEFPAGKPYPPQQPPQRVFVRYPDADDGARKQSASMSMSHPIRLPGMKLELPPESKVKIPSRERISRWLTDLPQTGMREPGTESPEVTLDGEKFYTPPGSPAHRLQSMDSRAQSAYTAESSTQMGWSTLSGRLKGTPAPRVSVAASEAGHSMVGYNADDDHRVQPGRRKKGRLRRDGGAARTKRSEDRQHDGGGSDH